MLSKFVTAWLRWIGGTPCFRVHGKARREAAWRVIDVYATHRRDRDSRWPWPFWRGTCIAWAASVIAVGWDTAEEVLREQRAEPASRERPVQVAAGRLGDPERREAAGAPRLAWSSELLAHEIGHTGQARRLGFVYWLAGAAFTLFREGPGWWHWFENQASEEGQFGGIVNGSVCAELMERLKGPV